LQIPIGAEANFKGVIDLVEMKAIVWHDETMGAEYSVEEIPADLLKKAEAFRTQLIEVISETDDVLMEKYLEGEALTKEEIKAGIRQATIDLKIFPALCGTAFKNKGIQTLLDAVVDYLPSPLDKPPVEGIDPYHLDKIVTRKAEDSEPLAGSGLQDHQRSFRQAGLCPRLLRFAQDKRHDSQSAHRQDGPHRPLGEDARQQARGCDRGSGRRHLRRGGSQGIEDRRHALRSASSDCAGRDHLSGYGYLRRH
jgi:hypothetical protein